MNAIPGGLAAYQEAVETAYSEPMHNPCVRWSLRLGFTAESELTLSDNDQYTVGTANYSADDGSPWMPTTRRAYEETRLEILAFQAALDAGQSWGDAYRAAKDAEFEQMVSAERIE